jgi:hypothetical protein
MARDRAELTDEPWEKIAPSVPEPHASPWGGPKPIPHRPCCEGILWILRTGPLERLAQIVSLTEYVLAASAGRGRTGCVAHSPSGGRCGANLMPTANSTGPKPLLMAALPPRKKGVLRRQHQTRQRYEVDGGGRRRRCACGKPPGRGVPAEVTLVEATL